MPVYEYKGIDSKGKNVAGIIDAENERAGRLKLRRNGIYTTDITLEGSKKGFSVTGNLQSMPIFQRVKISELAHLTRQMATLLGANIPLVDALGALQDQVENPLLKKSMSQIKEKVVGGQRLADAMKAFPKIYGDLYISMIQAGEASGALELVLQRLADFTESQAKLKSKITSALMYPVIMGLVGTALMLYLLVSVVPKIVSIFEDAKAILPLPTRILMAVSSFAQNYWYFLILIAVVGGFLFKRYINTEAGRLRLDRFSLKMPIFGELFRKVAVSRFSRTLATLLHSGVQLLPSLDIVKNVVGNKVLSQAIETTKLSVKEGESIAEPLRRSGEFPPMVLHMIAVGEKTGALESMLEKVADSYDGEIDTTVGTLTTLLEPLLILVMGGVVSFIVLSILLPILKMSEL
ncbi:MAG TPA: type II secretion system protein GspF [Deltaproteobacteria bacterium]|nr:MAG: type II secretion system protein GspF [Deltaproteobacteria bacterium GWA2_45_12]HBF13928.1 type II secretion system protein GspF [Deltaproteobacteria bacterium]